MKGKKFWFWLAIIGYLFLALSDGALTYINTPDLSREGNPLVAVWGLGWSALAIANVLAFALLFTVFYYSTFRYKTVYTQETKFTAYCSQITYDRPDKFWTGLIPKHITPFLAGLGYCLPYAMIVARVVVVLEWLCVTFSIDISRYNMIRNVYLWGRVDVVLAAAVALVLYFYWFYKEFKKQLVKE